MLASLSVSMFQISYSLNLKKTRLIQLEYIYQRWDGCYPYNMYIYVNIVNTAFCIKNQHITNERWSSIRWMEQNWSHISVALGTISNEGTEQTTRIISANVLCLMNKQFFLHSSNESIIEYIAFKCIHLLQRQKNTFSYFHNR